MHEDLSMSGLTVDVINMTDSFLALGDVASYKRISALVSCKEYTYKVISLYLLALIKCYNAVLQRDKLLLAFQLQNSALKVRQRYFNDQAELVFVQIVLPCRIDRVAVSVKEEEIVPRLSEIFHRILRCSMMRSS